MRVTHPIGHALGRWLRGERKTDEAAGDRPKHKDEQKTGVDHDVHAHAAPWYATLWLTGVDYFSSLGYAPGISFLAAGYVAPVATLLLVAVTFLAAVPVYAFVAKHSSQGEGSIKMIERLTTGWGRLGWLGKSIVLILLGFAMTDFVITITLSAADATVHMLENPHWPESAPHNPVMITAFLILLLCAVFLKGFREAIGLAILIAVPYMVLNGIVIAVALDQLIERPELLTTWVNRIIHFDATELRGVLASIDPAHAGDPVSYLRGQGVLALALVSIIVFPKLALGLSGFETGVSVMPLISGKTEKDRVRGTRKLLMTAAALMTIGLLGSSLAASILIAPEEFGPKGKAHGRALAYLAHELLGSRWGTLYDIFTVMILWFAGASAMAGLLNIIPRYLPRFGMSPTWIEYRRPLVLVITLVCLMVNWSFSADVEAQGGAYATGVLVLMASGAFAVMLAEWDKPKLRYAFRAILGVFLYVLAVNVIERPDGIRIAGTFIFATIAASLWSRWQRASEFRVQAIAFDDKGSEKLWEDLKHVPHLVVIPLRSCDAESRRTAVARSLLHLEVEKKTTACFLNVELTEDPSMFTSPIRVRVAKEENDMVIYVRNAVAVANAIAYVSITLDAEEVVIGLLDSGTPVVNALLYLLLGTGEVGYAVRSIFMRIREQQIAGDTARQRSFDREHQKRETELLRDMVDATAEERAAAVKRLFEEEAVRFTQSMAPMHKLPRLILVG